MQKHIAFILFSTLLFTQCVKDTAPTNTSNSLTGNFTGAYQEIEGSSLAPLATDIIIEAGANDALTLKLDIDGIGSAIMSAVADSDSTFVIASQPFFSYNIAAGSGQLLNGQQLRVQFDFDSQKPMGGAIIATKK